MAMERTRGAHGLLSRRTDREGKVEIRKQGAREAIYLSPSSSLQIKGVITTAVTIASYLGRQGLNLVMNVPSPA